MLRNSFHIGSLSDGTAPVDSRSPTGKGLRPAGFSGIVWREIQPMAPTPPSDKLPQLVMRCERFDALPPVELPEGYALHTLAERGEQEWIEALNSTGQLGEWDEARAREWLEGDHHVVPEASYIVVSEGTPVATTCLVTPRAEGAPVEVGWVSASPDHQGKGLGYQVTLAVLLHARDLGWSSARLWTDDWRPPCNQDIPQPWIRAGHGPREPSRTVARRVREAGQRGSPDGGEMLRLGSDRHRTREDAPAG